MKNIKGNILWTLALALWVVVLLIPTSRGVFIETTKAHPYLGGFFKFAILATMGDLLGAKLLHGQWKIPQGLIFKAMVWGFLGIAITLVYTVFTSGVAYAQTVGKLPFEGNTLALAFFGSSIMNLTFGPMLYVYHKFGDLYVDHCIETKGLKVTVRELESKIDWETMVGFSWLKTCIWVWIPCHTAVFLIPSEYRVLVSAFLSILLGILVAFSKKGKSKGSPILAN